MSELNKRIISGVLGIILIIILILKNSFYYKIALFVASLIALYEFSKAVKLSNINLSFVYLFLSASFIFYETIANNRVRFSFILIIVLTAFYILKKENNLVNSAVGLFSILYIPFNFMIMGTIENKVIQGLIFVIAFSTDTFAYFVGKNFGKQKLCPKVSPNKSVEGAIGGIIGCIVICLIYLKLFSQFGFFRIIIIAVAGSIVSQIGDLTASRIKRATGIKDFGNLIPGHGGILDRFDSVILVAPLVYFVVYGVFYGGY